MQEFEKIKDLCRKWNSICKSIHNQADHFLTAKIINKCSSPSPSPSSSASVSSSTDLNHHHQQSLLKLRNYYKEGSNKLFAFETKPELLSNPNSSPNSASSSEASEDLTDLRLPHKFFEDNLEKEEAVVCGVLEKKVPALEKELIREIVSTIFKCRSGKSNREREDTWLSFLGPDSEGKDKIGRELAKAVFGSSKEGNFVKIGISAFSLSSSSLRQDDVSIEEVISSSGSKNKKKRPRDERGMSYFERFGVAVRENPSRVFFLEDFDQTDNHSRKRFKRAMESGSLSLPDDDESVLLLKDAIIVFISSEESVRRNNNNNNNNNGGDDHSHKMEEKSNRTPLDLNVATEEEDDEDENCVSENGILNLVDKKFVFKN